MDPNAAPSNNVVEVEAVYNTLAEEHIPDEAVHTLVVVVHSKDLLLHILIMLRLLLQQLK